MASCVEGGEAGGDRDELHQARVVMVGGALAGGQPQGYQIERGVCVFVCAELMTCGS